MNARWQKILVLGWLLASAAWLAWAWPRSLALALGGWAIAASTSLAWLGLQFVLHAYHEHALTRGSSSKAVSYIEVLDADNENWWGAGVDTDIIVAGIKALVSAINSK